MAVGVPEPSRAFLQRSENAGQSGAEGPDASEVGRRYPPAMIDASMSASPASHLHCQWAPFPPFVRLGSRLSQAWPPRCRRQAPGRLQRLQERQEKDRVGGPSLQWLAPKLPLWRRRGSSPGAPLMKSRASVCLFSLPRVRSVGSPTHRRFELCILALGTCRSAECPFSSLCSYHCLPDRLLLRCGGVPLSGATWRSLWHGVGGRGELVSYANS